MSVAGRKAVVLLSGGLDSATVLAMAKADGFSLYAMSFLYGQRHAVESSYCARALAAQSSVIEHREVEIDLSSLGGSALTTDTAVPKHDSVDELPNEIPITYVPARNTIFFPMPWRGQKYLKPPIFLLELMPLTIVDIPIADPNILRPSRDGQSSYGCRGRRGID